MKPMNFRWLILILQGWTLSITLYNPLNPIQASAVDPHSKPPGRFGLGICILLEVYGSMVLYSKHNNGPLSESIPLFLPLSIVMGIMVNYVIVMRLMANLGSVSFLRTTKVLQEVSLQCLTTKYPCSAQPQSTAQCPTAEYPCTAQAPSIPAVPNRRISLQCSSTKSLCSA